MANKKIPDGALIPSIVGTALHEISVGTAVYYKATIDQEADYDITTKTYSGLETTSKIPLGAINEAYQWDRALLSGIVYYLTPRHANDILKIKSNIYLGSVDPYSRTQFWNYEANSVLRLGSLTSDGDPVDTTSEGSVFYGQNAQADAMSNVNFGYARIKPNRIGLYNGKSAGYTGYLFRLDTLTNECYLKDNSGNTTLNFNRTTGALTLSYLNSQAGAILFGDTGGNKIVSSSANLYWDGSGILNNSASPYFRAASNLSTSPLSGLKLYNTNDGSSSIYHNNEIGDSILDIDALTGTNGISTIRFGYNTTATTYRYLFYSGPASYSSHPVFTSDTQLVDKKYVDDAVLVENSWDRTIIPTFYTVLTPHTSTDRIQVPTISGSGTYGGILYTDLDGNKTITASGMNWSGAGFILGSATPYFKAYDTAGDSHSGLVWGATGNALGYIYHTSYVGAATLDIDAKPASVSYASTIRHGYNTTASAIVHEFYSASTVKRAWIDYLGINSNYRIASINPSFPTAMSYIAQGQCYNAYNGSATDVSDVIFAANIANAVSMTGTGSALVFKQAYYDASPILVDSGRIYVETEGNWTATASTQDSKMVFTVAENGSTGIALTLASDKTATFVNTINISKTSGSSISSFLNLTETVGSNIIIEHNQNNGIRYYSGSSYKRSSTEYWFVGMTDADDNYHIKDSVAGVDAITITTNTHAVAIAGNVTIPNLAITYAGTLKTVTNFLTLNNTSGAVDNDGTGTAIYVRQAASDLNQYDCGKMYWLTETDWTSTASTRDSSLIFQVALNGTLTTKLKLASSSVYISNSASDSNEFSFNNSGGTIWFDIDSKSNSSQSMLRFKKNGSAIWDITSRNQLDTPNDRLSFFYTAGTEIMYLTSSSGLNLLVGGITIAGTYVCPSDGGLYIGNPIADGTWLMSRSGNNLIFSRRESGAYVTKSTISA